MKKILLLSVLFSGVCMANIGEQFDYDEIREDAYRVYVKMLEDESREYANEYCIGDYAKYKYMIENDDRLLMYFVGFQCEKNHYLMERFKGLGYKKFPDLSDIIDREHYGNRPWEMSVQDLIIRRFSSGKSDVDAEIPVLVSKFYSIFLHLMNRCDYHEVLHDFIRYIDSVERFCKCIEGASTNIPEDDCPCMGLSHDQIEFLGILRNDIINTAKAHYENLLQFVLDKCGLCGCSACEFVVKLCMCTLIELEEKLCHLDVNDNISDELSKTVVYRLCNSLMNDLIEIGKPYCVKIEKEQILLEVKYAKIRKHERELEKEVNDLRTEIARLEEENENLRNRN